MRCLIKELPFNLILAVKAISIILKLRQCLEGCKKRNVLSLRVPTLHNDNIRILISPGRTIVGTGTL